MPRVEPGRQELPEVVEVGGVAAVADHDTRQVDAFLGEDPLLVEPASGAAWVWVEMGRPVLAMDAGDGPQDALDAGREPGLVGGALEDARAHAGAGDAVLDVVEEELVQHVHAAGAERARCGSRSSGGGRCRCRGRWRPRC